MAQEFKSWLGRSVTRVEIWWLRLKLGSLSCNSKSPKLAYLGPLIQNSFKLSHVQALFLIQTYLEINNSFTLVFDEWPATPTLKNNKNSRLSRCCTDRGGPVSRYYGVVTPRWGLVSFVLFTMVPMSYKIK